MKVGGMYQIIDTIIIICEMNGDRIKYWDILDSKMMNVLLSELTGDPSFKWIGGKR